MTANSWVSLLILVPQRKSALLNFFILALSKRYLYATDLYTQKYTEEESQKNRELQNVVFKKIDLERDFAAGVYLSEVRNPKPSPPTQGGRGES